MEKKHWKKPQLICLVRSKPEEMVLAQCKTSGPSAGADNQYLICGTGVPVCPQCSALGQS